VSELVSRYDEFFGSQHSLFKELALLQNLEVSNEITPMKGVAIEVKTL